MSRNFCASGGCQAACSPAQGYSASLDPKTFRWPDINYNDHTSSDWQLSHHLLRTGVCWLPLLGHVCACSWLVFNTLIDRSRLNPVALYRSYLCSSCSDAYQKSERQGQANGALEAYITLNPTPPQVRLGRCGMTLSNSRHSVNHRGTLHKAPRTPFP